MARAALSSTLSQARGRVGDEVLVKTRSGWAIRPRPKYKQGARPENAAARARLRQAVDAWYSLDLPQVEAWRAYARTVRKTDSLTGEQYSPIAYNVFVGLTTRFLQATPDGEIPLWPPTNDFPGEGIEIRVSGVGDRVSQSSCYDASGAELSGSGCLEGCDGSGQGSLFGDQELAQGGDLRTHRADQASCRLRPGEYCGRLREEQPGRVPPVLGLCERQHIGADDSPLPGQGSLCNGPCSGADRCNRPRRSDADETEGGAQGIGPDEVLPKARCEPSKFQPPNPEPRAPTPGRVRFTASGPNSPGVTTEFLVQKLPNIRRSPTKFYKSAAFHTFTAEMPQAELELDPGVYCFAYRFVHVQDGQSTGLEVMGSVMAVEE
ncbi:MAG TPA: hypothetical protein VEX38_07515 [Fimbriimonadaceae bacterium]|nr:hypothetical protein [Fimbriimonadaceae bacterium]